MKIASAGDAGLFYIKDQRIMLDAREYLYLGIPVKQKSGMDSVTSGSANWWEYDLKCPGRRAILNDIAGAIGYEQIKKLPNFISRRQQIHAIYSKELMGCDWLECPPVISEMSTSSYYFYWIQTKYRDDLARFLLQQNIYSTFRYWPLHRVGYFQREGAVFNDLEGANYAADHTLNIPIHQSLSDSDVCRIISAIKDFGRKI
jgi:aminotransferase